MGTVSCISPSDCRQYDSGYYADEQTGNPRINKTLSAKRAQAVADALTENGIAADRITVDSKGDTVQPYATPEKPRVTVCLTSELPIVPE